MSFIYCWPCRNPIKLFVMSKSPTFKESFSVLPCSKYIMLHYLYLAAIPVDIISCNRFIMTPFDPTPLLHNDAFWSLCSTSVETLLQEMSASDSINKICIQYEKNIHKNIWLKFIWWNICFSQCINTLKHIFNILLKNPNANQVCQKNYFAQNSTFNTHFCIL